MNCDKVGSLKNALEKHLSEYNRTHFRITFCNLITHEGITSKIMHGILSIYKQTIWQTRAALYWSGHSINIEDELQKTYNSKIWALNKTGIG